MLYEWLTHIAFLSTAEQKIPFVVNILDFYFSCTLTCTQSKETSSYFDGSSR